MSNKRERVYCCMKRIGRCKRRIEFNQARTKLGKDETWRRIISYVGTENSGAFNYEDVLCQSCLLKVRKTDLQFGKSKRKHEIVPVSPKTLRSNRVYHEETTEDSMDGPRCKLSRRNEVHREDNAVPGPSWKIHKSNMPKLKPLVAEIPVEAIDLELFSIDSMAMDSCLDVVTPEPSMEPHQSFVGQSQSSKSMDSQLSSTSNGSRRTISFQMRQGDSTIVLPGISSVAINESRCFVCRKSTGRSRIPNTALFDLYMKTGVLVPEKNRICKDHVADGLFTQDTIDQMVITKPDAEITGKEAAKWIKQLTQKLKDRKRPVDFNVGSGLVDADYRLLTGIGESDFNSLLNVLKESNMRESTNRTLRNALGIFLVMLRLGVSQRVLSFLFGISNQSVISDTIDAVSEVLLDNFVPKHLGYKHLPRNELMKHMSRTYTVILQKDTDDLILILDGTYIYVEKSTNFYIQRRSYSSHKVRNLFKPMMVVTPNGYILECEGLYFSDGLNNDSKIFHHMWKQEDSITSILQERDCLLLDRGFRDILPVIKESKIDARMPSYLTKGEKQFSVQENAENRKITKLRWVVESANGRLKGVFSFFHNGVPAAYFPKLNRFLRINVSIINAYMPPLFTDSELTERMAFIMVENQDEVNEVQVMVENQNLHRRINWIDANEDDVLEFPELTLEELHLVSLGKYQFNMAKHYNDEHLDGSRQYKFLVHTDLPGLLRVRIQSRFSKRQNHLLWIHFEEFGKGREAIKGYYCRCKSGSRTIGCCTHVAAVLRYLCLDRYLPARELPDAASWFLDAAEAFAEDSDSEDEEEDNEVIN